MDSLPGNAPGSNEGPNGSRMLTGKLLERSMVGLDRFCDFEEAKKTD